MGFLIYNIIIGLVSICFIWLYLDFILKRLNNYNNNRKLVGLKKVISIIIALFCSIINIIF